MVFAVFSSAQAEEKSPVHHQHHRHVHKKQTGIASYYGDGKAGKPTASGEPLDPSKLTAASKTLPPGTKAEVTNKENGKKVEVTVTDRGPYVKGRIIDVTPKAAECLGMKEKGTVPVEVTPLEVPEQKPEKIEAPPADKRTCPE